VPSLGASRTHWPVVAWIRLKVPPPEAPILLLGGTPPPPPPPLEIMERNPVTTDPRKKVYAYEEERDGGAWVLRLVWDTDDPELLEAELRAPMANRRPDGALVRSFWAAVRERIAPLGPLPVLAADPPPR
jgi:hypothetical protein